MRVKFDYFDVRLVAEGEIEAGEPQSGFCPASEASWSEGPVITVDPDAGVQDLGPMLDRLTKAGILSAALLAATNEAKAQAMDDAVMLHRQESA